MTGSNIDARLIIVSELERAEIRSIINGIRYRALHTEEGPLRHELWDWAYKLELMVDPKTSVCGY